MKAGGRIPTNISPPKSYSCGNVSGNCPPVIHQYYSGSNHPPQTQSQHLPDNYNSVILGEIKSAISNVFWVLLMWLLPSKRNLVPQKMQINLKRRLLPLSMDKLLPLRQMSIEQRTMNLFPLVMELFQIFLSILSLYNSTLAVDAESTSSSPVTSSLTSSTTTVPAPSTVKFTSLPECWRAFKEQVCAETFYQDE